MVAGFWEPKGSWSYFKTTLSKHRNEDEENAGWYKTRNTKLTVSGQSKERNRDLNETVIS